MRETTARHLPNARMRRFMLAIQEVMGRSGLTTILRQAGLPRYAVELPPDNGSLALNAGEFASIIQAIENYYGRGARGTLHRIGHAAFNLLADSQKGRARLYRLAFHVMPLHSRQLTALNWLARDMAAPKGQVTARHEGARLVFSDYESDATFGRARDTAICWYTLGEIQEALEWSTRVAHHVAEVNCRAKGDPVCRFDIGEAIL